MPRRLLVTANGCRSMRPSSLIVSRNLSSVASFVEWAPFTFASLPTPAGRAIKYALSYVPQVPTVRSCVIEGGGRSLLFVSCTRGRAEETDLFQSLQKLDASDSWFFENNENGLSVCYNSVLDDCAGSDVIVVFAHDDVTIGDLFLREKLDMAFDRRG